MGEAGVGGGVGSPPTQADGVHKAWREAPPDVERWLPMRRHGGAREEVVMQSVLAAALWVH